MQFNVNLYDSTHGDIQYYMTHYIIYSTWVPHSFIGGGPCLTSGLSTVPDSTFYVPIFHKLAHHHVYCESETDIHMK